MPTIPLKKPIEHDGATWSSIEFDPSLGALETFEESIIAGTPEIKAMIQLIAADGDVPIEVVRKMRQSDLEAAQAEIKPLAPLPPSTASSPAETGGDGEASRPILHTS